MDTREIVDRFPAGTRSFSLPRRVQTGPEAHIASCLGGIGDFFLNEKRPGRGADHSRHLMLRLGMSEAIPPLLHILQLLAWEKL